MQDEVNFEKSPASSRMAGPGFVQIRHEVDDYPHPAFLFATPVVSCLL
jgi:hypothetical protein